MASSDLPAQCALVQNLPWSGGLKSILVTFCFHIHAEQHPCDILDLGLVKRPDSRDHQTRLDDLIDIAAVSHFF